MTRMAWVFALLGLIAGVGESSAAPVIVNGRMWLQPTEFVNLSWDKISERCSASTGQCSGALENGKSVDGYIWASVDDVNGLFNFLISGNASSPMSGQTFYTQIDSTWGPELLSLFTPVIGFNNPREILVMGWTRSEKSPPTDSQQPRGYAIGEFSRRPIDAPRFIDAAETRTWADSTYSSRGNGSWFYRAAELPSPGTVALVALGLAVLGIHRRAATPS